MHWPPEGRHASVVVVEVVVDDVVVVDVVVVDVVMVVSGAGHGSKRPKPNNPPQGAAVVVVVVVTSHTSLATSEQVWEPHENLNSPQVTSQVWEQSWPLHWSTQAAFGSVKRQHTALDEASGLASALNADTKPTKARRQNRLESIILHNF